MISVGFDPSFIDTILVAKGSDDHLLESLPFPGHHHRNCEVIRVAGGNSVNVANVLTKLGIDIELVVPSNDLFDALLRERQLTCHTRINAEINETVALTWKPGEIQFNAVKGSLGREHWTSDVHESWTKSAIKLITNWSLNPKAVEWGSCQILAASGWSYSNIANSKSLFEDALRCEIKQPFVVETGSLKQHKYTGQLYQLLNHIADHKIDHIFPVFLGNEEEEPELKHLNPTTLIIHTADYVDSSNIGTTDRYTVPQLTCENPNFVGAGDAFFGGLVCKLVREGILDVKFAIRVSQDYICGIL